jgi:hypothetical protein
LILRLDQPLDQKLNDAKRINPVGVHPTQRSLVAVRRRLTLDTATLNNNELASMQPSSSLSLPMSSVSSSSASLANSYIPLCVDTTAPQFGDFNDERCSRVVDITELH